MSRKVDKNLNPDLVKAINSLLKEVVTEPKDGPEEAKYSLTDKMKVLDRALALEKIKQKIEDDAWGSGFAAETEDEEPDDQRG